MQECRSARVQECKSAEYTEFTGYAEYIGCTEFAEYTKYTEYAEVKSTRRQFEFGCIEGAAQVEEPV